MAKLARADAVVDGLRGERDALKVERDVASDSLKGERAALKAERDAATAKQSEAAARSQIEAARQAAAAKTLQAKRATPRGVVFKDFVNFPEEYAGGCLRFDDVWLHGDFDRVEGTKELSPAVSSRDGKYVRGRKLLNYADGVVFIISEEMGRPMSIAFGSSTKYGVNLCCEVEKSGKIFTARIYRVETLSVSGTVKEVYEEK